MFIEYIAAFFLLGDALNVEVKNLDKPVPNLEVNLLGFQDGKPLYNEKRQTNRSGTAKFELGNAENLTFVFRTIYQDIQYISDFVDGNHKPEKPIRLSVYDSKPSDPRLVIRERSLFFKWTGESISVDDEIIVENNSPFTIVGKGQNDSTNAAPETLKFSLPSGAHDLRFELGYTEEETRFEGNDIIVSTPFLPGLSRFSLKYNLETKGKNAQFLSTTSVPLQKVTIGSSIPNFFPESPSLKEEPSKFFENHQVSLWSITPEQNQSLLFTLNGIPRVWHWPYFLPGITLILLSIFGVLGSKNTRKTKKPHRKELIEELAKLDILQERKAISAAEYQARRFDLLSELVPFYVHDQNGKVSEHHS